MANKKSNLIAKVAWTSKKKLENGKTVLCIHTRCLPQYSSKIGEIEQLNDEIYKHIRFSDSVIDLIQSGKIKNMKITYEIHE